MVWEFSSLPPPFADSKSLPPTPTLRCMFLHLAGSPSHGGTGEQAASPTGWDSGSQHPRQSLLMASGQFLREGRLPPLASEGEGFPGCICWFPALRAPDTSNVLPSPSFISLG